jgi:hypothetical protein
MTTAAGTEERMGARPVAGETPGCAGCGHPYALHSNGRTPCRAFACSTGPVIQCGACNGTTSDLASGEPCETCEGTGSTATPCRGFTHAESGQAA